MAYPKSPSEPQGGMVWVPRMLDKARLMQSGDLPEDYHKNLGEGHDGRCCKFLEVDYADVKQKVADGLSDSEILEWCFENGRRPTDLDIELWNGFMSKLGWSDKASEFLASRKEAYDMADRDDIQTLFNLMDADEER